MSQSAMDFSQFDAETFLARRLGEHGARVFLGLTDQANRKDRFRAAINEHGLDAVIVGRNLAGKTETYEQLFQRIFNEPLHVKQPKRKSA